MTEVQDEIRIRFRVDNLKRTKRIYEILAHEPQLRSKMWTLWTEEFTAAVEYFAVFDYDLALLEPMRPPLE